MFNLLREAGFIKLASMPKSICLLYISLLFSPVAWVSEKIVSTLYITPSFARIMVLAILIDLFTGVVKHWKLSTLDFTDMVRGFLIKAAISFLGMALFSSMASIEELAKMAALRDYFILIGKLCVFFYVGGSAFNNMYVITGGKFPPMAWIKRMKKFGDTLDITSLSNKNKSPEIAGEEAAKINGADVLRDMGEIDNDKKI